MCCGLFVILVAQKNKAVSHDFVVGFSYVGPALHLERGGLGRTLLLDRILAQFPNILKGRTMHMAGQLRFDSFIAT